MIDKINAKPVTAEPSTGTTMTVTDPGDAVGRHVEGDRLIVPGTLHETADEAEARGSHWRRG